MSRRGIIVLAGIVTVCSFVVIILYAFSEEPLQYSQDFTRVHRLDAAHETDTLDLGDRSYYIAGITTKQVFFGNLKDSLDLLVTDLELGTPKHIRLKVDNPGNLRLKGARVEIDSPFFYIKAGNARGIFRGTMDTWQASRMRMLDSVIYFDNAVSLTKNSFAFRATGTTKEGISANHLGKVFNDNQVEIKTSLLKPQVDTYFSTLGVLLYSKMLNELVYVYHYRNQYLLIDTTLTLQHEANTIDSVSQAHIKPIETSKGRYEMASMSGTVNRDARIYEDKLFVQSALMASNETKEVFDRVSVIDVYDLRSNRYLFSFYLPHTLLLDFTVAGKRIIAIHDHFAVSYSFDASDKLVSTTIN